MTEGPDMPVGRAPFRGYKVFAAAAILFLSAIVLLVADPFSWHLLDRLSGEHDAALVAVPQDSLFYVGVNLLSPQRDQLAQVRDIFAAATAGSAADFSDLEIQLESRLSRELGISFNEDIRPWLGQYIGLALVDVHLDGFGRLGALDWLLVIETRNRGETDQFLAKLEQGWANATGTAAANDTIEGLQMTSFPDLSYARSGSLLLLAGNVATIRDALQAQRGESLADDAGYRSAVAELPGGRLATLFLNGPPAGALLASFPTPLIRISQENLPTRPILGAAASLSAFDSRLQIDTATVYDPEKLSVLQRSAVETYLRTPTSAELFPENTLFYVAGLGLDLAWSTVHRSLVAEIGRDDFQESMELAGQQFGINPDEELFPLLTGEAAIGLVPSDSGTIASLGDFNAGVVAIAGTEELVELRSVITQFAGKIGSPQGGLGQVTLVEDSPGSMIYEFETILIPDLLLAFGVGEAEMLLGSSASALQSLRFNGGATLGSRPEYQEARTLFAEDMSPTLFIDVNGLANLVAQSGVVEPGLTQPIAAALRPVPWIAGASSVTGSVVHHTLVIPSVPTQP